MGLIFICSSKVIGFNLLNPCLPKSCFIPLKELIIMIDSYGIFSVLKNTTKGASKMVKQ